MTDFATMRKRQLEEAQAAAGGASSSGASSSTGLHNSNYGGGAGDPASRVPTPELQPCRRARTHAGKKVMFVVLGLGGTR